MAPSGIPNQPVVLKIGGSLMDDDAVLREICGSLAEFKKAGNALVLVHGGGKDINRHLEWLNETPRFLDGLRVTSEPALKMVEMTLSGYVNKRVVALLNLHGAQAAGISGVDGPTFLCRPLNPELGKVGAVTEVRTGLVAALLGGGFLPVVSPISVDEAQSRYNVNADDAARALAEALGAGKLIFLSDVAGVFDRRKERIPGLDASDIDGLIADQVATGGMIPKLNSCREALAKGVKEVHICRWNGRDGFLAQLQGTGNSGTIIVSSRASSGGLEGKKP